MATDKCTNAANHTPCPGGYVARAEWALEKGRRHYVVRCPGCGLYAIWKRRKKTARDWGGRKRDWEPG